TRRSSDLTGEVVEQHLRRPLVWLQLLLSGRLEVFEQEDEAGGPAIRRLVESLDDRPRPPTRGELACQQDRLAAREPEMPPIDLGEGTVRADSSERGRRV